jgi:hypothetical protein
MEAGLVAIELMMMAALAAAAAETPQIFAPGVISAPVTATAPTFSPDASNVIFEQQTAGKRRLMTSHKTAEGWSDPVEINLGGEWTEAELDVVLRLH